MTPIAHAVPLPGSRRFPEDEGLAQNHTQLGSAEVGLAPRPRDSKIAVPTREGVSRSEWTQEGPHPLLAAAEAWSALPDQPLFQPTGWGDEP